MLAQVDGQSRMPEFMDRGPIIDNINANAGSLTQSGAYVGELQVTYGHSEGSSMMGSYADADYGNREDSRTFTMDNRVDGAEDAAKAIAAINRDMRFYPNPAISILQVDLGNTYTVSIQLMSVMGQDVFHFEGETRVLPIDVSRFPQGTYLLTIAMGQEIIVKRVQIAK
jgi:hypothetical protein